MYNQLPAWIFIKENLTANIPVMLMYVVESKGSSPGRQGFMMAVDSTGGMKGSIGGGIMEHKFVELCRDLLKGTGSISFLRKQVHDKTPSKDQSGMICSGDQTIFFYKLIPDNKQVIESILQSIRQGKNGVLALSPAGITFSDVASSKEHFSFLYSDEANWLYEEVTGLKHDLHIIGAGHCGLALSRICEALDFTIHLYDHRKDLNTFHENIYAHEKILVKDYAELEQLIIQLRNQYVVIMTFGYRTDYSALTALQHKDFRFIGLLGSSKKIEKMKADHISEFNDPMIWEKIHAPVGLPIHSQTPMEIAISIAAQIIATRNTPQ